MICLASSDGLAIGFCAAMALAFVLSMYLIPSRLRRLKHSDEKQIVARFYPSLAVCLIGPAALYYSSRIVCPNAFLDRFSSGYLRFNSVMEIFGVRADGFLRAVFVPLGLFVLLFIGALTESTIRYWMQQGRSGSIQIPFLQKFFPQFPVSTPTAIRNLVVAPIAEELIFRACFGIILKAGGFSTEFIVLFSPVFFGLAHLHHFYSNVKYRGALLSQALGISLVQFVYTSLFGFLQMLLFLRTHHLISIVLVHSWCNLMGLPSTAWLNPYDGTYKYRHLILLMHLAGILGFARAFWPYTEPSIYGNTNMWEDPRIVLI